MHSEFRARTRLGLIAGILTAALLIAACGSSSSTGSASAGGDVQSILQQTFSNGHTVKSGNLGFAVTVTPTGSSLLTTPITFSLSGPFQSHGAGKLPSSDFTVQVAALGKQGSLGIISTGSAGYATLQGSDYQLPQTEFKRLESSFSSASGNGSQGGLAGLGINPRHWLENPVIAGTETVNGARTTHIRAGVNASALLSDLNTFLSRTAKGGSTAISPATQRTIAAAVKNATVDIWTGASDHILRRLALQMTIPVSGQTSSTLGGLTSAGIGLTIQYSHLNQPQTITAPTHVLPYSQFTAKLRSALSALGGGLAGLGGGTTSGGGASAGTGAASPPAAKVQKYSRCIQAARRNIAKMQKCAPLLNGG